MFDIFQGGKLKVYTYNNIYEGDLEYKPLNYGRADYWKSERSRLTVWRFYGIFTKLSSFEEIITEVTGNSLEVDKKYQILIRCHLQSIEVKDVNFTT